jgi:hypothetical protein
VALAINNITKANSMSNLIRLAAVLSLTVATAACSGQVPSDGFKDLRYGMSLDELRSKGFNCEPTDYYCRADPAADEKYTLFGKEASVSVDTEDGMLASVKVHVDLNSDELISLYTKEFGRPKTFTYRSLGGQSERHCWYSGDRAAICVTRLVARGDTSVLGVTRSSAEYLGPEATRELLEEASTNTVRGRDF